MNFHHSLDSLSLLTFNLDISRQFLIFILKFAFERINELLLEFSFYKSLFFFVIPLSLLTSLLGNGSPVINCTDSQTVPIFTEISLVRVNAPIEASLKTSHGHFYKWEKGTCVLGVRALISLGTDSLPMEDFPLFFNSHQLPGAFRRQFYSPSAAAHELKAGKDPPSSPLSTFFFRSAIQRNEIIIDFSRDKCFNTFTLSR